MQKLYKPIAVSVMKCSSPRKSKGEPTEIEFWRSGVTENEQHKGMPLDGSWEHKDIQGE
jgi:hypothetical protein